jgi:hypothetical protein
MTDPFSGGIMPQVIQNRQGLQGLEMNQLAMQQQQQQMQQQQAQQAREAEAEQLLSKFQQSGGIDFSLINQAVLKSPTAAKNVLATIGIADKAQKQRAANDIVTLMAALDDPNAFNREMAKRISTVIDNNGNPAHSKDLTKIYQEQGKDAAKRELQIVGAALANEGFLKPEIIELGGATGQQPASIQEIEYYEKLKATNPDAAAKFAKARGYVDSPREEAQTPQEKNMARYQQMVAASDPNAEAFGRSAGLISKEGQQLTATAEKEIQSAVDQAELNAVNTTKYLDLASRFKESDIAGGILGTGGSWREALKSATGSQDEVSKIVGEWTKIRSGEAIASLPQGPATDADIRLALKPLPENANGEYMDKYLRGLAKMAEYKAEFAQAKADFISTNGSLRAKDGKNFGKVWAGQRMEVLERIKNDPKFLGGQAPAATPATKQPEAIAIEGYTVEVVN